MSTNYSAIKEKEKYRSDEITFGTGNEMSMLEDVWDAMLDYTGTTSKHIETAYHKYISQSKHLSNNSDDICTAGINAYKCITVRPRFVKGMLILLMISCIILVLFLEMNYLSEVHQEFVRYYMSLGAMACVWGGWVLLTGKLSEDELFALERITKEIAKRKRYFAYEFMRPQTHPISVIIEN